MAAAADPLPTASFGLVDFDALDASGRPQLEDGEQLAGDYDRVTLVLGDNHEVGQGHLYISSRRIIWLKAADPAKGCYATFPTITMHAISQEPQPCIYAQLEAASSESDDSDGGDFFYNEEEVLNGGGAENRVALLDRYDAMLDASEQPELEELTGEDLDRFADPDEEELPDATHPSA